MMEIGRTRFIVFWLILIIIVFGLQVPLMAQQTASRGTVEVGAQISGAFDLYGPRPITGFRPSASEAVVSDAGERKVEPAFGGSFLVSLSRNVWIYSNINRYFAEERTATAALGSVSDQLRRKRQYTTGFGGIQVTYPTPTHLVPYVNLGGGVVHFAEDETETTQNLIGVPAKREGSASLTTAALHFGGGLRVFVGDTWGFRGTVEGFYTKDPLRQILPFVVALGLPEQTRHGFGQIAIGFFKEW